MTIALDTFARDYDDYSGALSAALMAGMQICKHADPVDDAAEGLDIDDALEVVLADSSLIYLSCEAVDYLSEIDDSVWDVVVGSQSRSEFARLTIEAGQRVEQAWADAAAHAEAL
jgi:hypothetical protein